MWYILGNELGKQFYLVKLFLLPVVNMVLAVHFFLYTHKISILSYDSVARYCIYQSIFKESAFAFISLLCTLFCYCMLMLRSFLQVPQRTTPQKKVGLFSHLHQYEKDLSLTQEIGYDVNCCQYMQDGQCSIGISRFKLITYRNLPP